MGNSSSKKSNEQIHVSSTNRDKRAARLSKEDFAVFQGALDQMPFPLSETQFSKIVKGIEIISIRKGEIVLREGYDGKGIYIVAEGYCEVFGSDDETPVRAVHVSEFFGEISTFFPEPCTATVACGDCDSAKLLLLKKELFSSIFSTSELEEVSKFRWYISRRYLDLNRIFEPDTLTHEIALDSLQNVPIFHDWSDASLKHVISTFNGYPFALYPSNFTLFGEGEQDNNAFLLLNGRIELQKGRTDDKPDTIVLSSGPLGLWIGDEGLFCGTTRRTQVVTVSPCLIMTIAPQNLESILAEHPWESAQLMSISNKWRLSLEQRDNNLYENSHGELDLETLRLRLRMTKLLRQVSTGFLYYIALETVVRRYDEGQVALTGEDSYDSLVLILKGRVSLATGDDKLGVYTDGDLVSVQDETLKVICEVESHLGVISRMALNDALKVYPETSLNTSMQ